MRYEGKDHLTRSLQLINPEGRGLDAGRFFRVDGIFHRVDDLSDGAGRVKYSDARPTYHHRLEYVQ